MRISFESAAPFLVIAAYGGEVDDAAQNPCGSIQSETADAKASLFTRGGSNASSSSTWVAMLRASSQVMAGASPVGRRNAGSSFAASSGIVTPASPLSMAAVSGGFGDGSCASLE